MVQAPARVSGIVKKEKTASGKRKESGITLGSGKIRIPPVLKRMAKRTGGSTAMNMKNSFPGMDAANAWGENWIAEKTVMLI